MNFDDNIVKIEATIGYVFRDKALLRQAFTRTSYCNEQRQRRGGAVIQSNEVLEFFGDTALSMAIITDLITRYSARESYGIRTEFSEGDFSQIKSNLSEKRNLSLSMEKLGLEAYLLVGEGDRRSGIIHEPSVMEDLFEAIIGAVYIDCGMRMETVLHTVDRMLNTEIYLGKDPTAHNPKGELQEFCADKKRRLPPPEYAILTQERIGNGSAERFVCECRVGEFVRTEGEGKNLKTAETDAARRALEILRQTRPETAHAPAVPPEKTPMSLLNEWARRFCASSPEYPETTETENSSDRSKEYLAECRLMGEVATGVGRSKKAARQQAAEKMLEKVRWKRGNGRQL